MHVGMDRLSYLIYDTQFQILGLRSYEWENPNGPGFDLRESLKEVFIADEWLRNAFQDIRIAVSNKDFTLIPDRLYNQQHQTDYLKKLVPLLSTSQTQANHLSNLGLYNVFALDGPIKSLLEIYFPNARLYHLCTALMKGFQEMANLQSGPRIFLNVYNRQVQILAFEDGRLILANVYDFQSSRDFIYYVMLVFDQFNWKPETVPVSLAGHIVEDSQIYHMLYRYIRHLSMVKAPSHWLFGAKFGETPRHFFFDLYSLQLCE